MEERTYRLNGVSREEVESEIDAIWKALQNDDTLRSRAREAGIDVDKIDSIARSDAVTVKKSESGFAGAELLIGFGIVIATDIWKTIILPRLKQRFGADSIVPK